MILETKVTCELFLSVAILKHKISISLKPTENRLT